MKKKSSPQPWTSKKLIFYTLLPSILTIVFTGLLILYYQQNYVLDREQYHSIWVIVRNFVNIFIVLGFIIGLSVIGVKWMLKKPHFSIVHFTAHVILAAIIINFTFLFCTIIADIFNVLKTAADQIPEKLGLVKLGN